MCVPPDGGMLNSYGVFGKKTEPDLIKPLDITAHLQEIKETGEAYEADNTGMSTAKSEGNTSDP